MAVKTMEDLFIHGLQDIYYAENQITKALPKMIDMATNRDLSKGLSDHLEETKKQIERLEQIFQLLDVEAEGVKCPAIDGILEEADDVGGEVDDPRVLDAALIASAQAVEHYEISRYGTLIAWAGELSRSDCADLLNETLEEEKATDAKLSELADSEVNAGAVA